MKVRTSARPYPFVLNLAFALFCLGGAVWGAYDYWIAYPAIQRANDELDAATRTLAEVAIAAGAGDPDAAPSAGADTAPLADSIAASSLSEEDRRRYEEATATIQRIHAEFGGRRPKQLAAWDRPLQLWLWVIGCGVLGFPFFVWPLIRMVRRRWELDEDGTLRTPWETIPLTDVTGIDMSRWCSPTGSKRSTWKAWLLTRDGRRHELDDHDYLNMHRIIGFYAHRFHPDEWTEEAKRAGGDVGEGEGGGGDAGSVDGAADGAAPEAAEATGEARSN